MSAAVMPPASSFKSSFKITLTGMRMPRMQGFPAMISGLKVIRSRIIGTSGILRGFELKRPLAIEVLEEIALVRLIPA